MNERAPNQRRKLNKEKGGRTNAWANGPLLNEMRSNWRVEKQMERIPKTQPAIDTNE